MAEVKKNDAAEEKTPAAKKPAAAKASSEKKPAATTAASEKKASEKKPAAEKSASKPAAAKKPASEKAASEKADASASSSDTAAKPTARKPAAKKEAPASRPGVLKAHHLRPAPGSKKARTRVGRGEGSKGKTAGRGTKGTKARYQVRAGLEGGNLNAIMRAPKLRGFTNPFRTEYQVVNLARLAELYPSGGDVTIGDLVAKGAVRKNEKVKVLGNGDISVKLNVAVDKVSSSAEQKIVAAGGSVQQ